MDRVLLRSWRSAPAVALSRPYAGVAPRPSMWALRMASPASFSPARTVSTAAKVSAFGFGVLLRVFYKDLPQAQRQVLWSRKYWVDMLGDSPRLVKVLLAMGILTAGFVVSSYDETPVTSRSRLLFKSQAFMRDLAAEVEDALFDHYGEHVVPESSPVAAGVAETLNRLVAAVDAHPTLGPRRAALGLNFRLVVIEDEEPKMFTVPSGTVFVFTGILDTVTDKDAFACMMGHEMVHALLEHRREELSKKGVVGALSALAYTLGFATGPTLPAAGMLAVATDKSVEKLLPPAYRRDLEREADVVGLMIAARACFDPRAAPSEWARLAALYPEDRYGFQRLSMLTDSHPSHEHRVEALQAMMRFALLEREDCNCAPLD